MYAIIFSIVVRIIEATKRELIWSCIGLGTFAVVVSLLTLYSLDNTALPGVGFAIYLGKMVGGAILGVLLLGGSLIGLLVCSIPFWLFVIVVILLTKD